MDIGKYTAGPNEASEYGIYCGDSQELVEGIPDNSIDMIFTDPIYSNVDDYEWLARTAARILKPGKSCLALAGNLEKPSIYQLMMKHLTYCWEGAIVYRGANFFMNSRAIQVSWKPVLWFSKGKREMEWCKDALVESTNPKQSHRWQQSDVPAIWFIRQLTNLGDVIFDPFCGWGAYPLACKKVGRHWLAFDKDIDRVEFSRHRVKSHISLFHIDDKFGAIQPLF